MAVRLRLVFLLVSFFVVLLFVLSASSGSRRQLNVHNEKNLFNWSLIPHLNTLKSFKTLPKSRTWSKIPSIQGKFAPETREQTKVRLERLKTVKWHFNHAWTGYKKYAWLRDEVTPRSGNALDPFGGWAATLVDALDTLWIMDMKDDFEEAVEAIDQIDFSTCSLADLNIFETTIRYLGGFLAAYDISRGKYPALLQKAEELGLMLYKAFDTPNRLPMTRWKFKDAAEGLAQIAPESALIAELGSLSLEFTRLSQLTGDNAYFDAVQRITDLLETQQDQTNIPGLWPIFVNARKADFTHGRHFTIGAMADSTFEYLPKNYLLLGGANDQYKTMYEKALAAMKKHIFFRPMTEHSLDILFAGSIEADIDIPEEKWQVKAEAQHLGCFAGGMVGIGARMFGQESDLDVARKLTEGCLWGYEATSQGILPEITLMIPCNDTTSCIWNEQEWLDAMNRHYNVGTGKDAAESAQKSLGLPKGMIKALDKRYILRPEAIESVFILYRLTGDRSYQDRAWNMFLNIISATLTPIAHAALDDCTNSTPTKADRMESFWMAETLKYFYLIFSEPDVISLDEYVFNTEAHPLKRPN